MSLLSDYYYSIRVMILPTTNKSVVKAIDISAIQSTYTRYNKLLLILLLILSDHLTDLLSHILKGRKGGIQLYSVLNM